MLIEYLSFENDNFDIFNHQNVTIDVIFIDGTYEFPKNEFKCNINSLSVCKTSNINFDHFVKIPKRIFFVEIEDAELINNYVKIHPEIEVEYWPGDLEKQI